MVDIRNELSDHLSRFQSVPFLFVGSGFSRRYMGLEDWEGLLRRFAEQMNVRDFQYYKSTAEGRLDVTAGLMARDFHDIWWREDRYAQSRKEFQDVGGKTSALKYEISKYLREKRFESGRNEQLDKEITALKNVVVDGVITTNWDLLIEQIFGDEFRKYIGQKELLFSNPVEVGELYKIHGCCSAPNSLVLTDDDYKDYNSRNAYLAAKLLTIFIEHPVVFIGYSMSDENIQGILKSIAACLTDENIHKLQDRLIFLQRDKEHQGDSFHLGHPMTINGNTITVTSIKTNDFSLVYDSMSNTKRKFSAKQLRHLKSQLYELVITNDPRGKITVVDYDRDFNSEDIEFVVGVGIAGRFGEKGYTSITPNEIYEEAMSEGKNFDYTRIVRETLPQVMRSDPYQPIFKFIQASGISFDDLPDRVKSKCNVNQDNFSNETNRKSQLRVRQQYSSVKEIVKNERRDIAIRYIPLIPREDISLEELREFIVSNISILQTKTYERSGFRRLICLYDWLRYGNNPEKQDQLEHSLVSS